MAVQPISNIRISEPVTVDESQINGQRVDPVFNPRPITSTLDTWDQNTQVDYASSAPSIGRRPSWNVPSITVASEPVNTIRQSALTKFASNTIVNKAAMTLDPQNTDPNVWRVVPNMAQNLFVEASVQVTFSLLISATVSTSPRFAVFRDGRQISQIYHQLTVGGTPPTQTLVSGTYVDPGATVRKYHVYDLRWRPTNTPVISFQKNRTFQASNMRAQ